ncbi:hypothetical protein EJ04DRAFT_563793 [Polyplosphaeria fusca]|uniref:Uncharacterized protein n=1 Tax=Polyplosphaeria fusca TaxID=682080 RepID=A0A9P4QWH0_9PLEO|nr:hypothetical protein EJ04DRAFT_563793 [Polyplosphaeria fusca]
MAFLKPLSDNNSHASSFPNHVEDMHLLMVSADSGTSLAISLDPGWACSINTSIEIPTGPQEGGVEFEALMGPWDKARDAYVHFASLPGTYAHLCGMQDPTHHEPWICGTGDDARHLELEDGSYKPYPEEDREILGEPLPEWTNILCASHYPHMNNEEGKFLLTVTAPPQHQYTQISHMMGGGYPFGYWGF